MSRCIACPTRSPPLPPIATQDVLLVVRETGERTREACLSIVSGQIAGERVRVIGERPFSAAVRRGLEIAAEDRPRWLFTLDADVLLTPTAIADLLDLCEAAPDDAFHVKGLLVCRVFGGTQPRGFHAFRGPLVPRALRAAGSSAESTRPETSVVRAMEHDGHPSVFSGEVLGLHDYEQSLRHLYLKMALRARKTEQLPALRARLGALADSHPDFRVAAWGLDDAPLFADRVELDWGAPLARFEERLRTHGLREKPPFDPGRAPALVDTELGRFGTDKTALSFPRVAPGDPPLLWPLSA